MVRREEMELGSVRDLTVTVTLVRQTAVRAKWVQENSFARE